MQACICLITHDTDVTQDMNPPSVLAR